MTCTGRSSTASSSANKACFAAAIYWIGYASNGGAVFANTAIDWKITGDLSLELRGERTGSGTGRVYTITVACTDSSGNTSNSTVTVRVPHDSELPD